jgi:hypothetical protein
MMQNYQWLLFDADGALFDSERRKAPRSGKLSN